ncbi:efflux pump antibiotic resistance [Colletotrichum truncatum]|uniref:Efflux pump antibiotic resistance n=1 Tax=Colletotrichum truncatum TaxID=5467 RepID=A0ACC3YLU3_COLTU|nr:efflux pump antibiotic resistance [Colletotrichum truncatum]KAF6791492.1 efflux pump antibiotic resistance [Colletotrichum truncatum]
MSRTSSITIDRIQLEPVISAQNEQASIQGRGFRLQPSNAAASLRTAPPDGRETAETARGVVEPPKLQTAVLMISLCACVFVAAIDVTIIATALPAIASNFKSASSYQWVGSAYVLGSTATTPSWGSISNIWGRKSILLLAVVVFFAGSLICALGDNVAVFLAGRAIQGIGGSGLLTLVNITISDLFSLRDRGLYFGLTSVVWALAAGIGPVLGGVFTQKLSWRWCFWINLPISAVVIVFLVLTAPRDNPGTPVWAGLKAVDWSGSLLIVSGTLMLLMGLSFGGVSFSWSSATVINLIVFGIFAGFLFGLNEWKMVKYPVMPLRLFHNRSAIACFTVCFCHGYILMGVAYYLPLYFQAVLGAGPLLSGVYLLPFILSNTGLAAGTGVFVQRTGKYIPAVYLGLVLMTLGTGLLINLDVETNWPKIVIYQLLVGAGVGLNFEGPLLALQASLDARDVATATATMGFTRMLASAISAIIGGVVFQNQMISESQNLGQLGADIASRLQGGEAAANVEIIHTLPLDQQAIAKGAFQRSLKMMWVMYTVFAAVGMLAGPFIATHTLSKERQATQLGLADISAERDEQQAAASEPSAK